MVGLIILCLIGAISLTILMMSFSVIGFSAVLRQEDYNTLLVIHVYTTPSSLVASIIPEAPIYARGIFLPAKILRHLTVNGGTPPPERVYLHKFLSYARGKFCSFVEDNRTGDYFCKIPERIYRIMLEFGKDLFYNVTC